MIVTPDRIVYSGLLGSPSVRTLGSLTLYIAPDAPFRIRSANGQWEHVHGALVPPNHPHDVQSEARGIWLLLIEPESVSLAEALQTLPHRIRSADAAYHRLRSVFRDWLDNIESIDVAAPSLDTLFLGKPIAPRVLDARLTRIIALIRAQPDQHFPAADCAREVGLSFSRFLHLFKQEIGMSFRTYCAWKRARALLPHVATHGKLTDLALQIGYPDSTHFSHSIRRIYGLTPRDILAGSRQLTVLGPSSN